MSLATRHTSLSDSGIPADFFEFDGVLVFMSLVTTVLLADLLLDFLGHAIDRRIHVTFHILGEQIRAAHGEAHGAAELLFRHARMVVLQRDARIDGPGI